MSNQSPAFKFEGTRNEWQARLETILTETWSQDGANFVSNDPEFALIAAQEDPDTLDAAIRAALITHAPQVTMALYTLQHAIVSNWSDLRELQKALGPILAKQVGPVLHQIEDPYANQ